MSNKQQSQSESGKQAMGSVPAAFAPSSDELSPVPKVVAGLQRALAGPPTDLQAPEVLALQRTVGNRAVQRMLAGADASRLSAVRPDAVQRSPAISNWTTRVQAAKAHQQAGRRAQATSAYQALIAEVINTIPLSSYPESLRSPAPGNNTPPTPVAPASLMVVLRNRPGGAVTFPSEVELSRGNPVQLWRWIEFHEESITETEEWTRGLVIHEMDHAGDMAAAYRRWSTQPPSSRGTFLDSWRSWMRSAGERHVDIYEHQASGGRFEAWSDEEKLEWITGVLGNVPENQRAGARFSGRSRINSYYGSVRTTPQGREVQELYWDMLFGSDRRRTSPGQKVTILTNFVQVRQDLLAGPRGSEMRAQISILRQVMRRRR